METQRRDDRRDASFLCVHRAPEVDWFFQRRKTLRLPAFSAALRSASWGERFCGYGESATRRGGARRSDHFGTVSKVTGTLAGSPGGLSFVNKPRQKPKP